MNLKFKLKLLVLCLLMVVTSFTVIACKTNNGGGVGGNQTIKADPIVLDEYVNDSQDETYITYDDKITVDGNVTSAEWASQEKFYKVLSIGGIEHEIEASAYFAEEGLIMYWSVLGAPAYYNSGRNSYDNSGVELYLAPGDAARGEGNAWEIDFQTGGVYASKRNIGYHKNSNDPKVSYGYSSCAAYMDFDVVIDGELNDPSNNGYMMEFMIPWTHLGYFKAPEYVCVDAAIINCTSEIGPRNAWYSIGEHTRTDYGWMNVQGWYKYTNKGFYDESVYEGNWKVLSINKSVIISEDGKDVTKLGIGKANSSNYIYYNAEATGAIYQEVVMYNPIYTVYAGDLDMKDYVETNDLGLGGLSIAAGSKTLQWAMHVKDNVYRVRWQQGNWQGPELTEEQLLNYNDPTKGLRIGLLSVGNLLYGYVEDNGVMKLASSHSPYNASGNGIVAGATYTFGLQTNIDIKTTDYSVYYGDSMATIPYVINGGEAIVGGSVAVNGSIFDGANVLVTPDDGYELDTLTVNGVEVTSVLYEVPAFSTPKLNIEVSFKESTVEKNEVALTVKLADIFTGEASAYTGYVNIAGEYSAVGIADDEGKVSVKLADGTYAISIVGYKPVTLTVADGVASVTEIILEKKLFVDNASWTITENNDGTYDVTSSVDDNSALQVLYFDLDFTSDKLANGFVLDFTFETSISGNSKFFPALALYGANGSRFWPQFSVWGTNIDYKSAGAGTTWKRIHSGAGAVNVDARFIVTSSNISLLIKNGSDYVETDMLRSLGFTDLAKVGFQYCNDYNPEDTPEEWSFSNIKLSTINEVPVNVADVDNATVNVDKQNVGYGNMVNIQVTLDEVDDGDDPYMLYGITVNGTAIDYVTTGNVIKASFIANDLSATKYDIALDVRQSSINVLNIPVKQGVPYDTLTALEDGTSVNYIGPVSGVATVVDGKITINIPDGEYTFASAGYLSTTVSILEGQIAELVLAKAIFGGNNTQNTYEGGGLDMAWSPEDGYSITTVTNRTYSGIAVDFDYTKGFEMSFKANFTTTASSKFFPTFRLYTADNKTVEAQFCVWNGSILWKNNNTPDSLVTLQSGAGTLSKNYVIRVEIISGVVTLILKDSDTNNTIATWTHWSKCENQTFGEFAAAGFFFNYDTPLTANESWSLTNITIKPLA